MSRHPIIEQDLAQIAGADLPWDRLRGKRVLITGASGFVAAYMVEALLYLNEQDPAQRTHVIALARNGERARERFAHYAGRSDLEFLVQDVCNPLPPGTRADFIIHAASQASPKFYATDPVGTLMPNVFATRNLLEFGREKESRFLFLSSGEVYGQPDASRIPTREQDLGPVDPIDVRSCYAESKRMGETLCVAWHKQYGVSATIARPFHTYGPGMRLDDGRVFADFVADVVANRSIVMKSDGSACRAFCYVADAVIGFFAVLFKGEPGAAYNVGNDAGETSILDFAELLAGLFPERGLRVVRQPRPPGDTYLVSPLVRNCPDISKARGLGWQPTTSLADGFRRTIRSFE